MEKAVQVPRMRDIYANAEEVVVWLGQGDQQIRDLLDRLAHTPDTATARKAAEIDGLGDQLEDLCVCSASGPKTSEELVKSMQALLCFLWFSRVWCKQEIWAARKASLHYEDISCQWQNFDVSFFERMVASTTGDVQSVPGIIAARQGLARIRNQLVRADSATLASVRDKDKCNHYLSEDCKLDIVNVIRRCYSSQCKDERDHVYGLMGMSSINTYIHEEDDKRNEMLSVDYSQDQSTAKTYEDLARYVIGRDDRLSIVFLKGIFDHEQPRGKCTEQPLPTWVPDWGRDYGSLKWLTSRVAKPLSEEQLPLV
ncbi:hypothetical protein M409DRAFT_30587 [Zasmidium cellare ATCC 36951]|uniref:Heterokaryon incompatibility domain-containing protein n=1 Tax=Zasmidium cellare ATCC 36951 TaxID=1080233 RepID=A0A6A6BWJ5_ZASCE|nr:uncharacterized protein M409DRAFT_30587 [Zasmidium cellare ATCC 36951]KAF2158963.1 hypothetical protein M409DRAFT_30587 [Zasmidium cellare ATCC 36951]